MARVIKCDICRAEQEPTIKNQEETAKWTELEIASMVSSTNHFRLNWDLCPLCTGWLTRTLQACKNSGGYPGGRG